MATNELPGDAEEPREEPERHEQKPPGPPREVATSGGVSGPGFFTIYKKGQGYWTRICSAITAGLLILVTANFAYVQLPVNVEVFQNHRRWLVGIVIGIVAGLTLLVWRLMNKPTNVDFLIATDSEMKKVNWTSKQELIGSTKVVIMFMILIATLLFTLDMYFTRVFYLVGVLVTDSPLWDFVGNEMGLGWPGKIGLDVVMSTIVIGGSFWAVYGTVRGR